MSEFATSLELTALYLTAQEKRAQIELEDSLADLRRQDVMVLTDCLAKRADAQELARAILTAVKQAKCRQKKYTKRLAKTAATALSKKADTQQVMERLRELSNTPLGTALLGGAAGATLGGASGLIRGKGARRSVGDAVRGGVAGAALGGGAGLVAQQMGRQGTQMPALTGQEQLAELNSAIQNYDGTQSQYLPMAATGLGWGYGMNVVDSALARRSPASAFRVANVGDYRSRTDMIDRLQKWLAANERAPGRDSVDAFVRAVSQETNPSGPRRIFSHLANHLSGGDVRRANSALGAYLDRAGVSTIANGDNPGVNIAPDIDAVARALNDSRPFGWQALPANLIDRISNLIPQRYRSKLQRGPLTGNGASSAVARATRRANHLNSIAAYPILRGRSGLLGALGILGAGMGADMMSSASGGDVTPSAEDIQRIREQLQ